MSGKMTWQKCCGNASRSTAPRFLVLAGGARNRYCYLVRSAGVVDTGEVRGGEGKGWGKKRALMAPWCSVQDSGF